MTDLGTVSQSTGQTGVDGSVQAYDLVILSHHKCATNWIRNILRVLAQEGLAEVYTAQGADKTAAATHTAGVPRVLANVNAFRGSLKHIDLAAQPVMHFVRDPRDALVSNYWSWLKSHQNNGDQIEVFRQKATTLSVEDGMILMLDTFPMGRQLESWTEPMWALRQQIRYEDLKADFAQTLTAMLAPGRLVLDAATLDMLRERTEFSKFSGREAGKEDTAHHYRKGVSGDWKNYFTARLEKAFFERHGWLGEKLGYW